MSVIRVEKNKNYTTMSNYHLRERKMSLKAKGLMSLMLSLPEKWDYSIAGLVAICKENETSIKTALGELKEFGYLQVIKKNPDETKSGRFEYEYVLYEEKQDIEKQGIENLGVEILGVENQGQLNTNNKITKELKNNNKENIKETEIFNYWNSKEIIKHDKIDTHLKAIKGALKENTVEQVKIYIDRYAKVVKDKNWFFNTKWTLTEFLKQKNAMNDFKDDGSKWVNYIQKDRRENKTILQADELYDDLDKLEII